MNPITGETTASVLSPTRIPADPPLTAHGVNQCEELAAHLVALEPPIDAVYSSPYYRCLQTISPFVKLRGDPQRKSSGNSHAGGPVAIRVESGLSEFYGRAPFDHPVPAELPVLKGLFPDIDGSYQSRVVPSRKGEGIPALYDRARSALENIIEQCDADGHRTVILCSHAAVVISLGRVLTGNIPETVDVKDFGAYTCGLSRYRRSKMDPRLDSSRIKGEADRRTSAGVTEPRAQSTGHWVCESNSDCSFLSSGPERGWYVLKSLGPTPSSHHSQTPPFLARPLSRRLLPAFPHPPLPMLGPTS